jgi:hypothetical protein
MTTTTYNHRATDLLVLLTAASGPKQDATIRAQLFFDHMKDFDYIVPNTISYNILVEAYAKNEGDKSLDSNFNLVVEEAHNAEGVLLDSTFQWWNIVFVMFWGVCGYGGSQEK